MTSAAEFEAALCQLEEDPPDIRQYIQCEYQRRKMDSLFSGRGQIPSYDSRCHSTRRSTRYI